MSWEDRTDRIDHDGPELLWQQVSTDLRADIESGALPPGLKLRGEYELADVYGVANCRPECENMCCFVII
jgi:GntR family transcriptional regulator